jgi:hypothetical protein
MILQSDDGGRNLMENIRERYEKTKKYYIIRDISNRERERERAMKHIIRQRNIMNVVRESEREREEEKEGER